jgi:hypothetical protein
MVMLRTAVVDVVIATEMVSYFGRLIPWILLVTGAAIHNTTWAQNSNGGVFVDDRVLSATKEPLLTSPRVL